MPPFRRRKRRQPDPSHVDGIDLCVAILLFLGLALTCVMAVSS